MAKAGMNMGLAVGLGAAIGSAVGVGNEDPAVGAASGIAVAVVVYLIGRSRNDGSGGLRDGVSYVDNRPDGGGAGGGGGGD